MAVHPVIPVLQLLQSVPRIEGRKKIQKTVHILKELGAPFQERFEYSYYGMYSPQLKAELDALENEGLVSESELFVGENKTFVIQSTPKTSELLNEVGLADLPVWVETARKLNNLSPQILEGISTILFLRRTENDESVIRKRLLALKPHLELLADACFVEVNQLSKFARYCEIPSVNVRFNSHAGRLRYNGRSLSIRDGVSETK